MNICADAHMACGCLVPLLADGIRGRKDAVVDRSGFSNKASSLPLGLWDKSNNLTHVFTPLTPTSTELPWRPQFGLPSTKTKGTMKSSSPRSSLTCKTQSRQSSRLPSQVTDSTTRV